MWARRLDHMPAVKPRPDPKPIAPRRPAAGVTLRRASNRAGLRGRSEHRRADYSFPPPSSEQRATRPVGCRCVLRTPSTRLRMPSALTSIGGGSMRSSGHSSTGGGQRPPSSGRAIFPHTADSPNAGWATGVRNLANSQQRACTLRTPVTGRGETASPSRTSTTRPSAAPSGLRTTITSMDVVIARFPITERATELPFPRAPNAGRGIRFAHMAFRTLSGDSVARNISSELRSIDQTQRHLPHAGNP
jgi:hypothetical protein